MTLPWNHHDGNARIVARLGFAQGVSGNVAFAPALRVASSLTKQPSV